MEVPISQTVSFFLHGLDDYIWLMSADVLQVLLCFLIVMVVCVSGKGKQRILGIPARVYGPRRVTENIIVIATAQLNLAGNYTWQQCHRFRHLPSGANSWKY